MAMIKPLIERLSVDFRDDEQLINLCWNTTALANECIELKPDNVWGYICKGKVHEKEHKFLMAYQVYQKASNICEEKELLKKEIDSLHDKWKITILKRFTTRELTNHLIFGYIRQYDDYMINDVIAIIAMYHDLYFIAGFMRMTIKETSELRCGDTIDHRNEYGQFEHATIIEKCGARVRINYEGSITRWVTIIGVI